MSTRSSKPGAGAGPAGEGVLVTPVVRETLHEQAYAKLRHLLMTGALRPGTEISLRPMAQQLGTSEMPVREAVRRLMAENALRSLPSRKVIVPYPNAGEFRELLAIRLLLEGEAARLACDGVKPSDLRRLRTLHARMLLLGPDDDGAYLELNQAFHFGIYGLCGLPLLVAMIETLWLRIGPIFRHVPVHLGRSSATDFHQAAIDALSRRSGADAAAAIASDLQAVGAVILASL